MIRLMVALMILTAAVPCMAQWGYEGYEVQRVNDGGNTYILYSSGHVVRDGGWFGRRELIDNGSNTRMLAAGGGRLYLLKMNGNIWMYMGRGMEWRMIDNGTNTPEIWVDWGTVYCRKDNGRVFRCVDPYRMQWQAVGGGYNYKRIAQFNQLHGK